MREPQQYTGSRPTEHSLPKQARPGMHSHAVVHDAPTSPMGCASNVASVVVPESLVDASAGTSGIVSVDASSTASLSSAASPFDAVSGAPSGIAEIVRS